MKLIDPVRLKNDVLHFLLKTAGEVRRAIYVGDHHAVTDKDDYDPNGQVELRLIHARTGKTEHIAHGHNVITSWQSVGGAAPTSGRDLMRRKIVPQAFAGSLATDNNAVVSRILLGSGTTAEQASDTALATPIPTSVKTVAEVEFDAVNPYVTFIFRYDESEVNVTIAEAALLSAAARDDFLSRKTFGAFTKTNEYLLEVRWTYRF